VPKYISKEGNDLLNQLLNKRPDKRITLDNVKRHEFFKGLDWDKLLKKELVPPILLKNEEGAIGEGEEDNEEYLFLKQQESKFLDRDYTKEN